MRGRIAGFLAVLGFLVGLYVLVTKMIESENADIDRICALPQVTVKIQDEDVDMLAIVRESVGDEIWQKYGGEDLFSEAVRKLNPGKWNNLKPGTKLTIPTCPKGRRSRAGHFF